MLDKIDTGARKLLVVETFAEWSCLLNNLTQTGWRIVNTSLNHAAGKECDVGVIHLLDSHLQQQEMLKRVIRQSGGEWIAVIDQDVKDKTAMRSFISEWFFDFYTLPFDFQRMQAALGRAYGMSRLRNLTRHFALKEDHEFLGTSAQAKTLRKLVTRCATTDSPVLIRGESGTGKELVARALHWKSRRADKPFVAVNCGAIPDQLIQSEMFGHEKGAFTGAHQRKIGRIEAANGGTLFLDEIGDLPLELQANMLRFLQEMQIERVGSTQPIQVDVRVVAATHIDLEAAIVEGRFREDLYYRLNVLEIRTAPLRDRHADIPILAQHFAQLYAGEVGRKPRPFSEATINAMLQHGWPGNVRELANRVRRGMVLAEGRTIEPSDLGLTAVQERVKVAERLENYILRAEKQALQDALTLNPGNMCRVAETLGISRPTLYRMLHRHQII
ncbi:sigma-54 dependent transcriptional regulator [Halopseudomonas pelagia]|uniref:Fis family transcriptional regulator n=1 Tax=Halopseudomonas pelagia TaxID=553151 RepID=A0AA91TZE2_9GAMM|nr:sigma-54 dependent transcriptional regulator [Halopseudomonas pelagia]PCC97809.1 Fis family transcriptional regulator [Halopseudomonas pelagia]QFY57343.1 sigma-54-dependent Fis family transcriptional regulator [Halopseudomonas pelagia]